MAMDLFMEVEHAHEHICELEQRLSELSAERSEALSQMLVCEQEVRGPDLLHDCVPARASPHGLVHAGMTHAHVA